MWFCNPSLLSSVIEEYKPFGLLFYNAIQTFLASQCMLIPNVINAYAGEDFTRIIQGRYDFIIVGGGTAGSIVASRLAEVADWNILVLEAGGEPTLGTEIPPLFINNYETNEDWNFRTEPQTNACLNYKEQRCYWPRGKVLGGTSSINGMYYITGDHKDFNDLAKISEDWSYENVKRYLLDKDSINNNDRNTTRKQVYLDYDNNRHPLEDVIINANRELSFNVQENFDVANRGAAIGIAPFAIKNGVRQSTYNVYLKPVKDKVKILKNVKVNDIVFKDSTAWKVRFSKIDEPNVMYEVETEKEVILSAGTINSAHILLKSGIKPEDKNSKHSSHKTIANLPVGKNLQDHIFVPIMFKMKSNDDSNSLPNIIKNLNDFITNKTGPLKSMKPQRVVSFISSENIDSNDVDIQNHYIVVYPNQSNFVDIFVHHKLSDQFYKRFNDVNKNNIILIVYVTLLQPKSKGTIELNEKNEVSIKANYLDDKEDLETLLRGMRSAIRLNDTNTFKDAGLELFWVDIDACSHTNKTDDEFLKCIARHLTGTLYHAVGTNKMGNKDDKTSVVDEKLQVKSVNNLRVIDASAIPNIPRCNTMSHVIMFAEKGAEFIKRDWLKYTKK